MILALVDDLMFRSKIRAAADRAGRTVAFVGRDAIVREVSAAIPDLVIVDLDRAPLDPMSAIREIKAHPAGGGVRIVGFVSHVRADLIEAARAAGAEALARSAFVARLPELMAATTSGDRRAVT